MFKILKMALYWAWNRVVSKINQIYHHNLSIRNNVKSHACMDADHWCPICNNIKQMYTKIGTHMTVLSSTKMSQLWAGQEIVWEKEERQQQKTNKENMC